MICEQCEHNPAEYNSYLCEECMDRNTPIAEGDLPNYKVVEDSSAVQDSVCTCDDEMCESCKQFQEMDVELINIMRL